MEINLMHTAHPIEVTWFVLSLFAVFMHLSLVLAARRVLKRLKAIGRNGPRLTATTWTMRIQGLYLFGQMIFSVLGLVYMLLPSIAPISPNGALVRVIGALIIFVGQCIFVSAAYATSHMRRSVNRAVEREYDALPSVEEPDLM
jgi:hypothetical protein